MPACFLCKKSFNSGNELFLHFRKEHHLTSESPVSCIESPCSRTFSSFNSLRKHLATKHTDISATGVSDSAPPDGDAFTGSDALPVDEASSVSPPSVNNVNTKVSVSVPELKAMVDNQVLVFLGECYRHKICRKDVDFMVENTSNFVGGDFLQVLKDQVIDRLSDLNESPEKIEEIVAMFDVVGNPFGDSMTEYKRLKLFESKGVFVPPKKIDVGTSDDFKLSTSSQEPKQLLNTKVNVQWIPMRETLSKFLNSENVFQEIKSYMEHLSQETDVLSNFIEGLLWKSKIAGETKFILPLWAYFDDFETGDALGSHAGCNKIGGFYFKIPCLPPEHQSRLENIFVGLLCYSVDRKEFVNRRIFNVVIEELKYLWETGIEVKCLDGATVRVFFLLGLFLGDNLGLNAMMGLVECFLATVFCRLCKTPKSITKKLVVEDLSTVRTAEDYNSSLGRPVQETGIKEECAWHEAPKFHMTSNHCVDIMHDFYEGVCLYTFGHALVYLVKNRIITMETLNNRIRGFDYGPVEKRNVPPLIPDTVLKTKKISMSAAEMKTFLHCFPMLVGDLVLPGNEVWDVIIKMREIGTILCVTNVQRETSVYLSKLIEEFLDAYMTVFHDELKPKFHNMVHYPRIRLESGPLVHMSCMRFESKNKEMKAMLLGNECKVNVARSIAVKTQLGQVSCFLGKNRSFFKSTLNAGLGTLMLKENLPENVVTENAEFFENPFVSVRKVDLKGTEYRPGLVVVLDCERFPVFGQVDKIFINDKNEVSFLCNRLLTCYLDSHYDAFICRYTSEVELVAFTDLFSYVPLTVREDRRGRILIPLKVAL